MTKKMVSFRLDTNLLKRIEKQDESKTEIIEKALTLYLQSLKKSVNTNVNTSHKENVNTNPPDVYTNVNTQNNKSGQVQIIENYELLHHYENEIHWLRDRVEFFEGLCSKIKLEHDSSVAPRAPSHTSFSGFRM